MSVDARLHDLGLVIPEAAKPVAAYVPAVRSGNLIFVSGQLPLVKGELQFRGIVGQEIDLGSAYEAARICAINCIAAIKTIEPNLDKVKRIVKVTGFVSSLPTFGDQPKVINGASELLQSVFGERGVHARAAVGVSGLPLGAAVEVEMIVEVE
ncbi:MAG: RidA family protein [Peptococcaceae bacterium]|nr:RidA family protein [Peptococcaceae bacterium]